MRIRLVIIALAALLISPCFARIITVDDNSPADFNNIQAAINDSNNGDTIIIQPGIYTGSGNHDIDFSGKAVTIQSTDPNDPCTVGATIIDCGGSKSQPHRGFYFHNSEGSNSVLDGLKIINGCGPNDYSGGGIVTEYASPMITRCIIKDNQAPHGAGGGIYCRGGTPLITHCIILNNSTAPYGFGGGIYCWNSSPIISNCIVTNNSSNGYGGGIYCNGAAPTITLCTITGNSALYMGGGICTYNSTSTINSCIVWSNTAPDGPEIKLRGSIYPTVLCCDVQGGFSGQGNFNLDPCFVNPTADDYHLMTDSPCINTGDPCYVPILNEKDIDGEARVIGGRVDVGTDEVNVAGPVIGVWPRNLDFMADEGGQNSDPQFLYISNSNIGTGMMNWQINEDCLWLSTIPNSGASSGEVNEVTIIVDVSEANQGLHECELVVTSSEANNSPQIVHVSLYIYGKLQVPSRYSTIQAAIDAARDGDTVLVADGVYTGSGNRNIDFLGKAITLKSENGPENCIIDCGGANHRGFIFNHNEGQNSVLDGFTITNAHIQVSCEGGAAIYCQGSSPAINNCIITGNSTELMSGSLCFCYGGAIYIAGVNRNPTFTNCIISDNSIGNFGWGGGIYCASSEITMQNCLISENDANQYDGKGGGIYCEYGGHLTLTNCTIADNTAPADSGGGIDIRIVNDSDMAIRNCIIWGNLPEQIYTSNAGTGTVLYSDIQGGWSGTENINLDPCFADSDNSDYHLKSQAGRWSPISQSWVQDSVTSPCIDAGNPGSNWTAELWPHGKRINMGAFGGTSQASMSNSTLGNIADLNNDNIVDYADFAAFANKWFFEQILLAEDLDRNGIVNFKDLAIFTDNWLWEE